jgi:hypothetical protein
MVLSISSSLRTDPLQFQIMNGPPGVTSGSVAGRRLRRLLLLFACLLLGLSPPTQGVDVGARIDRTEIRLNETVALVLEMSGAAASAQRPDLSVLAADFEIVDRRSQSSITQVNGRRSERRTLTLRLLPRRTGELRVPPIPYGDTATEPLLLRVAESTSDIAGETSPPPTSGIPAAPGEQPADPEVVLEAALEPVRVRVDQQVVLTARVLMDTPIVSPRLRDPQPANTRVLPLGEDRYQTERDGRSFSVYERRYALFPREEGLLELEPLQFEGWVRSTGAEAEGMGYPPPDRPVRARSRSLTVRVLQAPRDRVAQVWLPARNVTLSESGPETYRAHAGQAVERRIGLRADGVMAADLPKVSAGAPHQFAKGRRQPRLWDERQPQGVIGTRQEVLTLTTEEPGHYRLPPISLDWWNSVEERWETAMLPARNLVVSAAAGGGRTVPVRDAAARTDLGSHAAQDVEREPAPAVGEFQRHGAEASVNRWVWIAIALALAWIATLFGWWRSRHPPIRATQASTPTAAESEPAGAEPDPLGREVEAVRAAYRAGDAAAAREALLSWAGQVLPERVKPSNLARLAQRCPEPLRTQVLMLEEAFFSPQPLPWDEQPVWEGMHDFEPLPPDEPASFRRGKPIRRRAPNPDAE